METKIHLAINNPRITSIQGLLPHQLYFEYMQHPASPFGSATLGFFGTERSSSHRLVFAADREDESPITAFEAPRGR